jgi:broad-specificity NMP kinase
MNAKKIIVCGVPRAGKTTLARKLAHQLHVPHIVCDPIITAFHAMFPHLGIRHTNKSYEIEPSVSRAFTQFLIAYITM